MPFGLIPTAQHEVSMLVLLSNITVCIKFIQTVIYFFISGAIQKSEVITMKPEIQNITSANTKR